jgi:hypothetical protein
LAIMLPLTLWAQTDPEVVGYHPGYVMDVEYEQTSRTEEFNIFATPPSEKKRDLKGLIFDRKLSKEFRYRYEQQFGRSSVEQNVTNPSRFDEYFYRTSVGVTLEEDSRRKSLFGEYMTKRLAEHHIDQYAKSTPELKRVYELKDRLSKVNVEVKKGYKVDMNYSLSGNFFQVRLKNPLDMDARIFMQMDPQAFGPGAVIDTRLTLGAKLNRYWRFTTDTFLEREGGRAVVRRGLAPGVSTSLTVSHFPVKPGINQREETLGIVGIAWTQ